MWLDWLLLHIEGDALTTADNTATCKHPLQNWRGLTKVRSAFPSCKVQLSGPTGRACFLLFLFCGSDLSPQKAKCAPCCSACLYLAPFSSVFHIWFIASQLHTVWYHWCWYRQPVILQLLSWVLASKRALLSGAADNRVCWVPQGGTTQNNSAAQKSVCENSWVAQKCLEKVIRIGDGRRSLKNTSFKYRGVNRRSVCCQWQWNSTQLYRAQENAELYFCHSFVPLISTPCASALQHPCYSSSDVAGYPLSCWKLGKGITDPLNKVIICSVAFCIYEIIKSLGGFSLMQ